jgi:hypothetical protein
VVIDRRLYTAVKIIFKIGIDPFYTGIQYHEVMKWIL